MVNKVFKSDKNGRPGYGNLDLDELRRELVGVVGDFEKASRGLSASFDDLLGKNTQRMERLRALADETPGGRHFEPFVDIAKKALIDEEETIRQFEPHLKRIREVLGRLVEARLLDTDRILASPIVLDWADFVQRILLYVHRTGPLSREGIAGHFQGAGSSHVHHALDCLVGCGAVTESLCEGDKQGVEYTVSEKGIAAVSKVLALERWNEGISQDLDRQNTVAYMSRHAAPRDNPMYFLALLPILREAASGRRGLTAEEAAYEVGRRYGGQKRVETIKAILDGLVEYGLARKREEKGRQEYFLELDVYLNPTGYALGK